MSKHYIFGVTLVGSANLRSVRPPDCDTYVHGIKDQEVKVTGATAEEVVHFLMSENAQRVAEKQAPDWKIRLISEPMPHTGLAPEVLQQLRDESKPAAAKPKK